MESKAALASSCVAYLPNVLYLTFWVKSARSGHDRALISRIVEHDVKHLRLSQDGLRGTEDKRGSDKIFLHGVLLSQFDLRDVPGGHATLMLHNQVQRIWKPDKAGPGRAS